MELDPTVEAVFKNIFCAGVMLAKPELADNPFKDIALDMYWANYRDLMDDNPEVSILSSLRMHRA